MPDLERRKQQRPAFEDRNEAIVDAFDAMTAQLPEQTAPAEQHCGTAGEWMTQSL